MKRFGLLGWFCLWWMRNLGAGFDRGKMEMVDGLDSLRYNGLRNGAVGRAINLYRGFFQVTSYAYVCEVFNLPISKMLHIFLRCRFS